MQSIAENLLGGAVISPAAPLSLKTPPDFLKDGRLLQVFVLWSTILCSHSEASATSKKTELKLTQVARASLEELKLDYEDFLRQRGFALWSKEDVRRKDLVRSRPESADDFAVWVAAVRENGPEEDGQKGPLGLDGRGMDRQVGADLSIASVESTSSFCPFPEIAANGVHALIGVTGYLLDRQIARLAADFEKEGGFTERLYRVRSAHRKGNGG